MSEELGITARYPETTLDFNGQFKSHLSKCLYKNVLNRKKRILCVVYKNCNIVSVMAFVCKNATFCKYKILPIYKLAKDLISFFKFSCLSIQSRIRG